MQFKNRRAAETPHPRASQPASRAVDTEDIDFQWEGDVSGDPARPPREALPTLHEEDPLRFDLTNDRRRDAKRDSMPTLPEIDPLRHDLDE